MVRSAEIRGWVDDTRSDDPAPVVPLTSGTLRLIEPEGSRDANLTAGVSYCRSAGVSHNVINVNAHEFRFLEIELK